MIADLVKRKTYLGLTNSYGIVFRQADDGVLSYTLRFPSWQEFYTRQTRISRQEGSLADLWVSGKPDLFKR